MSLTLAGGTLRVTTPASYDARSATGRRSRLPGAAASQTAAARDVLLAALAESGMEPVGAVDLQPRRSKGLDGPPVSTRTGTVKLDLDVAGDEDAVVLVERDGVYSWHLPVRPDRVDRSLEGAGRTVRFEIAVRPQPPRRRATSPRGHRSRGLLGDIVHGAAQALVFRYVAPVLLEKAIDQMEEHVQPGLVHLTGTDVESWHRFDDLAELALPTDRPVRLLLLVHGTFSSTIGGFGALAVHPEGRDFLGAALTAYDAVIGFDHRTLSLDPRENAADLLERLRTHDPAHQGGVTVDVITHSRGGLTTRSLVEELLPGSGWSGTVENIVFVAATNAGTHLADPERWGDLVDLYTNLAAASARALSLLPQAAPVALVVAGVVKGIGAFVKWLVSYAAEGDAVPGLEAMVPGGSFVRRINRTQPGQPAPGTSWFVVSSNFHVELFDDDHHPAEFPRELVVRLGEGFVDRLFRGDNDLVVDTDSMSAIDRGVGGFVRDSLALGENDVVYHTNYFSQPRVIEAISQWLPLDPGAGGRTRADRSGDVAPGTASEPPPPATPPAVPGPASQAPPAGVGLPTRGVGGVGAGGRRSERPRPRGTASAGPPRGTRRSLRRARAPGSPPAAAPPPGRRAPGRAEPAQPGPELTRAQLAAEMPEHVVVRRHVEVRVRLSRKHIEAGRDVVSVEREVEVEAGRPVSVQVFGKTNVEIVGTADDVLDLPSGGGTSELVFTAKALVPGPATVLVVVRQGTVVIASVTLTATAVSKADEAALSGGASVSATMHTGIDAPELEGLPCIDIVERQLADGAVVFQYAVRLVAGQPAQNFESARIKDRQRRIGSILDSVADLWRDTDRDPKERERKLQDVGTRLFDELFPEPMQAYLWKHRSKVENLIVYADEPFVPWELVHLKPPDGPRPSKPRFLAQGGLVRWPLGSFPPRELHVGAGRARALCPDYLDPRFVLAAATMERQFLVDHFGASEVTATPSGVRKLLRSGEYDLLHFSGHGAADPDDILDAKLLLRGRRRAGTIEAEYLGATTVSENAGRAAEDHTGPIVVLNACQVGRSGELLSTVGGFAKAFLDAGAAAFVSCLWSVHQEPSRIFVEKLYEELLAGTPMATASARAREVTRKAGDATWLSFVVYARPDAVLTRTPAPPPDPTPTPAPTPSPTTTSPGTAPGKGRTDMARYALCVGINEFKSLPRSSWLNGCVNDANDIAKALKKFGFTARSTTVLRDKDATKRKVMSALKEMVGKAKAGDHLVFTFSSHGTQVPSEPGDEEPDGLDEAFACYDIKQGGDDWDRKTVIVDDELRELFEQLPEGVLLEVLLDTCHSGTGLRDLDDIQQAMLLGRVPRYLPPPTPRGLDRARSIRAAGPREVDRKALVELTRTGGKSKPVLYAACRPDQTAADATFDGRSNGAFTYLFLKTLAEDPARSRSQLQSTILKGLRSGDFDQRSTLEGPAKAKKVPFGTPW